MRIVGIDPGISKSAPGAVAGIDTKSKWREVVDLPVVRGKRKSDTKVDGLALMTILKDFEPELIVTELLNGRPGQGAGTMWRMAESYGIVLGVCMVYPAELLLVHPASWKRKHGLLGTAKEASRAKALKLLPELKTDLRRKKDHGRAEAGLLALYGQMVH